MAFNNITNLTNGEILQIAFSKGLTSQMARDYLEFDGILMKLKDGLLVQRQYQYMLLKSLGQNAVKWQDPGSSSARSFPSGEQVTTQEVTAYSKQIQTTIELPWDLWDRARKGEEKYLEPLQMEIQAKLDASKRELINSLFGDGTGILGEVSSTAITFSGGIATIVLSSSNTAKGSITFFEIGDKIVCYPAAGGATAQTLSTVADAVTSYLVVRSIDRANNTITVQGYNSSDAALVLTKVSDSNPVSSGDMLYRQHVSSGVNTSSVSDYGTVSEVMAGLESLLSDDGRTVFGVTMSGITAGSRFDAGGDGLNRFDIEQLMNKVKRNGGHSYNWDQLIMAYEAQSDLIDESENDKRFGLIDDIKRGARAFAYQHRNSTLFCDDSIVCPRNRAYALPKPKSGEQGESGRAIQFMGSPFENVKFGNQDQFSKTDGSGNYTNISQQFLNAYAVMIAKHPGACGVIENFTVSN